MPSSTIRTVTGTGQSTVGFRVCDTRELSLPTRLRIVSFGWSNFIFAAAPQVPKFCEEKRRPPETDNRVGRVGVVCTRDINIKEESRSVADDGH